ncbi:dTDP-4-dehydrorhamnose reductase [Gammaproteobacteria bacterium]|nr:dTDP-4-dehydrorhamnose reductase [Gammaproteobacteria bacterium]
MKILVLGSKGQLGQCLEKEFQSTNYNVIYTSREQIDVGDLLVAKDKITRIDPDIVINATAYVAVDSAESDEETAILINHLAVANIAKTCREINCLLVHISTDYVFDGDLDRPYNEADITNPQTVYGQSKLDGELAIQSASCKYLIIRTAWVFSEFGNNFLKTMLRIGSQKDQISVVDDQVGSPTYAMDLAKAVIATLPVLMSGKSMGVYHYAGVTSCSWAHFAKRIFNLTHNIGVGNIMPIVIPISSKEYPTPALRPKNSRLDSTQFEAVFGFKGSDWEVGIRDALRALDKLTK